jgi:F0F1-type ATP synthase assembly protein I
MAEAPHDEHTERASLPQRVLAVAILSGAAIGAVVGVLTDYVALGVAVGVGVGLAVGEGIYRRR